MEENTNPSSSPIVGQYATSETTRESIAPYDLSSESMTTLYQLSQQPQNLVLLKAASMELAKRQEAV